MEEASNRRGEAHDYLASHPVTSERVRMFRDGR